MLWTILGFFTHYWPNMEIPRNGNGRNGSDALDQLGSCWLSAPVGDRRVLAFLVVDSQILETFGVVVQSGEANETLPYSDIW